MATRLGKKFGAVIASAFLALGLSMPAQAIPVEAEIALLMDVSGSVSTAQFDLQLGGYEAAFRDAAVQTAIEGTVGGVAVALIQWSGYLQQVVSVGWSQLQSAADAIDFADDINAVTRAYSGQTGIAAAIDFALDEMLVTGNGFVGERIVIDVSGDGRNNDDRTSGSCGGSGSAGCQTAVGNASDDALAAGVDVINGVVIGGSSNVLDEYTDFVIGGTNGDGSAAFALAASTFADFTDVITRKLQAEISGGPLPPPTAVPEPATLALLGLGLLGLAGLRRRT